MFPKNVTSSEALAPPLGAAQVAPIRPRLMDVWIDVCRGYFDVMGHYDSSFNCTKDTFIYCCGTCHYRFCCPDSSRQLDQDNCRNYHSPDWAKTQTDPMMLPDDMGPDTEVDPLKQQSHNTGIVIGGVIIFMIVVAVACLISVCLCECSRFKLCFPQCAISRGADLIKHTLVCSCDICRTHPSHEQCSTGSWRNPTLQQTQQHQIPTLLPPLSAQPGPAAPVLRECHQARAQPILLPQAPRYVLQTSI
uniref:Shisa family member 7a n=1 Tax=Neogobius melanostomus TaxID=47308 RepID=A0A8C6SZ27_9GOBI